MGVMLGAAGPSGPWNDDLDMPSPAPDFVAFLTSWYAEHARPLPWRAPEVSAWGVLVSEVMLQQTPVARVAPVWCDWLSRWPAPAALAAESPGEAVRAWGRLGYPRRALRLHATAVEVVGRHGGEIPGDVAALRALPGIGSYTAAAVAAFAFDRPVAVLDTNVRRVLARWHDGVAGPVGASPRAGEVETLTAMLPEARPGRFSVAVMELGAVVCTARAPRCELCPVSAGCAWLAAGRPGLGQPLGVGQTYAGTDRQARGVLLALARESHGPVPREAIDAAWADTPQRDRALASLLADGLLRGDPDAGYQLPD
jgi:A/G-specific adenine glycosylase